MDRDAVEVINFSEAHNFQTKGKEFDASSLQEIPCEVSLIEPRVFWFITYYLSYSFPWKTVMDDLIVSRILYTTIYKVKTTNCERSLFISALSIYIVGWKCFYFATALHEKSKMITSQRQVIDHLPPPSALLLNNFHSSARCSNPNFVKGIRLIWFQCSTAARGAVCWTHDTHPRNNWASTKRSSTRTDTASLSAKITPLLTLTDTKSHPCFKTLYCFVPNKSLHWNKFYFKLEISWIFAHTDEQNIGK